MTTIVYPEKTVVESSIINKFPQQDSVKIEVSHSGMSPDHGMYIHMQVNGKIIGNVLIEYGIAHFYPLVKK